VVKGAALGKRHFRWRGNDVVATTMANVDGIIPAGAGMTLLPQPGLLSMASFPLARE